MDNTMDGIMDNTMDNTLDMDIRLHSPIHQYLDHPLDTFSNRTILDDAVVLVRVLDKLRCIRAPAHLSVAEIVLNELPASVALESLSLSTEAGRFVSWNTTLDLLLHPSSQMPPVLSVVPRLCGGKGGFGSMLRAQGGRMNSKKKDGNNDACRDLSGRRIKTLKDAKNLAAYIEREPERQRKKQELLDKKVQDALRISNKPKAVFDDVEFESLHQESMETIASAIEIGLKRANGSSSSAGDGSSANVQESSSSGLKRLAMWDDIPEDSESDQEAPTQHPSTTVNSVAQVPQDDDDEAVTAKAPVKTPKSKAAKSPTKKKQKNAVRA